MQPVAGKHMAAQRGGERRQQGAGLADPVGHGRARQIDALTGIDLRLTIERQMIAILRGQHMGNQAGRGLAALDRRRWHRRGDLGIAAFAHQPWLDMAQHPERGRHIIQHLADRRAGLEELAAAAGRAGAIASLVHYLVAGQMIGQGLACGLRFGRILSHRQGWRYGLGDRRFDILQRQFKLRDGTLDLLRRGAEARSPQHRQLRLQLLDQRIAGLQPLGLVGDLPSLRRDDRAEHLDIIGQVGGGSAHQGLSLICPVPGNRYAVLTGGEDQEGRRQSMPSHSMANCALVSRAVPSADDGQGKRPFSSTL
jgi:hypothetical protein